MRVKKTNPKVNELIASLYAKYEEKKNPIWRDLAKRMEKPRKSWANPNLTRISRVTKPKEDIIVPGKVLGKGLTHQLHIYAFDISKTALDDVKNAGGTFGSIKELMIKNPTGKGVKIIK